MMLRRCLTKFGFLSNRDIYKDEFGNYQEVEEFEEDELLDGIEDDEQDHTEDWDESESDFDNIDDEDEEYDEDREYANERTPEFDLDD